MAGLGSLDSMLALAEAAKQLNPRFDAVKFDLTSQSVQSQNLGKKGREIMVIMLNMGRSRKLGGESDGACDSNRREFVEWQVERVDLRTRFLVCSRRMAILAGFSVKAIFNGREFSRQ
jgi:hypothetical protein